MSETKGRLDIFISRLVEEGCKRAQAKTGFDFWNGLPEHGQSGVKQITEDLIEQCGIPRVPVDLPRVLAAGLADLGERGSSVPVRRRGNGGKPLDRTNAHKRRGHV